MKRTLAISDIHGQLEMLQALLLKVNYNPTEDQLILLGDYVDRGPDSAGVIDFVMKLREHGAILLKGNHEELMYKSLTTDSEYLWTRWIENGGAEALQSYGYTEEEYLLDNKNGEFQKPNLTSPRLKAHLEFIQSLEIYIEQEDFIFVHAGVNPEFPLSENTEEDFLWIRDAFHHHYAGTKTVIFGHTPTYKLYKDPTNHRVYFGGNNIIGIDGGAVFGGQLNCLEIPTMKTTSIKANKETNEV